MAEIGFFPYENKSTYGNRTKLHHLGGFGKQLSSGTNITDDGHICIQATQHVGRHKTVSIFGNINMEHFQLL